MSHQQWKVKVKKSGTPTKNGRITRIIIWVLALLVGQGYKQ